MVIGTWRWRVEVTMVLVMVSGGPQPSGLKGTTPTSKPPTIAEEGRECGVDD